LRELCGVELLALLSGVACPAHKCFVRRWFGG
jgi:hypothetical protein